MSEEEARVVVNRNPEKPKDPAVEATISATRDAREKLTEAMDQAQAEAEARKQAPPSESNHEPIEDVESVEVELPNGLKVEFGPPRNISLNVKIIKILGDQASSVLINGLYRILLSVRSVNGKAVTPVTNTIEAEKLANQLGDDGIDILSLVSSQYFRPLRLTALPVIKKNLRTA